MPGSARWQTEPGVEALGPGSDRWPPRQKEDAPLGLSKMGDSCGHHELTGSLQRQVSSRHLPRSSDPSYSGKSESWP